MDETTSDDACAPSVLAEMTSELVAVYVSHNRVQPSDLPALIASVHAALANIGRSPEPAAAKPTRLMPIRKTVSDDHIVSLEDGRPYKALKRHLAKLGLTPQSYREKWGLPLDYLTTGVGPRAYAVREAMTEYLQVVTTTERDWLRTSKAANPPGAEPIYSLNLITTGFVQQPGVSDVLKSALLSRVDDLTNARTDRLTLSRASGNIAQWISLIAFAVVTQFIGAMAVAGQRGGAAVFLIGFTLTAIIGFTYLGQADGLIGIAQAQEESAPFATLLAQTPRLSASENDTSTRMRNTGKIVIGARTDTFPFSYPDGHGGIAGYSVDLCRSIVDRVRIAAGLGPVQVDVIPLSPANRVAMIENSTADMECDLTTETSGREGQVAFLDTIFYGSTQIALRAGSSITDIAGLKGKRVAAVAGSSNIQAASDLDTRQHLGLVVVPAKDTADAFRMMSAGDVDAMISSETLVKSLVAAANHPADYTVLDSGLGSRKYGIMIRRGNDTFQDAAVRALHDMMHSGDFEKTYDRWFTQAPPAGGINLALPMSIDLQRKVAEFVK